MAEEISDSEKSGTLIQSVSRAARLLLTVAERPGTTAKELAALHGLALPTTYHLLNTLAAEGLLAKDERRRYGLGVKAAVVADAYARQPAVPQRLLDALERLAAASCETVYLAIRQGGEIRVVGSVEGASAVRVARVEPGAYLHGHARATGKLLLALMPVDARAAYLRANPPERLTARTICDRRVLEAEFERIRAHGYATDVEEYAEGVACVAAPFVEHGVAIGALSLTAPVDRFERRREELIELVCAAVGAPPGAPR